jgi:hypothetical protein
MEARVPKGFESEDMVGKVKRRVELYIAVAYGVQHFSVWHIADGEVIFEIS